MISPGVLSPWPGYPEIPIFLDTRPDHNSPESQRTSTTTFDTSHSSVSPVSPLNIPHFIKVTPPSRSANYSSKTPNRASTHQFDRQYVQQQSKKTSTRFLSPVDQTEKPPVPWKDEELSSITQENSPPQGAPSMSKFRFGDFPSTHKGEKNCPPYASPAGSGLGISNGSYGTVPSGVYPSHEKFDDTNNFVQRIEDTLWRYSLSRNVFKRWLLETISWAISALCMAGIVIVLFRLQNRNSDEWPLGNYGITLNTYVAILSRIASAALLLPVSEALGQLKWSWFFQGESKKMWDFEIFDNASRGPWGSFQLLLRTKGRKLAALGACIVLLALALDPFFQQVVDFPDRYIKAGNGILTKTRLFEPKFQEIWVDGALSSGLDDLFVRTTYPYFYGNGSVPIPFGNSVRPDIPVSCPTSNCTWEPYETLGMCSACENVSDLLTFECMNTRIDWFANQTGVTTEDTYPNGTVCGYFVKPPGSEPILVSGYSIPDQSIDEEVLLMRNLPLLSAPLRDPLFGDGSIHFKDYRNPIIDALIVTSPGGEQSVKRNATPNAYECVLTWCVKEIQSSYFEAAYHEEITHIYHNKTKGPFPWNTYLVEDEFGSGYMVDYLENVVINAPSDDQQNTPFGASNDTQLTTLLVFDTFFPSVYTKSNITDNPLLRYKISDPGLKIQQRELDINPWAIDTPRHMENLATAMTNAMRSSESREDVVGQAYQRENYIQVRFQWLALPLGLLLFSGVFLTATVVRTSREKEHVGVWKTSAVATLLYGLPDEIQKKMAASASGGGTPRTTAKQMKVQLQPGKGWRVSGNWFSPLADKVRRNQPPPGWI
ncbi:hypothetical protein BU24DRAFT_280276 [Aaosphaeria arxii CBS 175.79]|uniref:DUF3176 domain containing protein n=1 Tax=Aaosphaeria arxii CBS 175.79 TaxID=1450172 RepID=A0A6A5XEX2_9PLEO|nr:uncharacterized protein BU24DRAFT_280276 [Aaosphaeria arxii CBS 175.79]KAF2011396.1 hypothetical protein BU24DRAFT_280276 [Aaosphaeria arxii CBS 175.79]